MEIAFRLVVAAVCAVSISRAQNSVEPFLFRGFGSTLFRLELEVPLSGTGADTLPDNVKRLGQSELEYPLDVFSVGLRYRHESVITEGRSVGVGLSAWINLSDPSSKMKDTDWMGSRATSGGGTATVLFKFSETESRAELRGYGGEAGLDIGSYTLFRKPVRYGLAVRAERFDYRMFGVKGTQFPDGSPVQVDQFPGQLVLTYGLIRIVPRLTADFRLAGNDAVTWNLLISGAPAFAFDHDDHVLRKKESDTFASGFEAGALTGLEFRLSDRASAVAALDVAYLRTKGDMDQHFYGDDPFTSNDETGTRYKNVVNRIIALGGSLSVGVRYRL